MIPAYYSFGRLMPSLLVRLFTIWWKWQQEMAPVLNHCPRQTNNWYCQDYNKDRNTSLGCQQMTREDGHCIGVTQWLLSSVVYCQSHKETMKYCICIICSPCLFAVPVKVTKVRINFTSDLNETGLIELHWEVSAYDLQITTSKDIA